MIEIWAFDMGSGALGNCAEFLHAGLAPTAWQALKAFPESFGHYPRHGFPRLLSDGRREAMRFRVFDMESFHEQFLSVNTPSVLRFYQWFQRGRGRPPNALIVTVLCEPQ